MAAIWRRPVQAALLRYCPIAVRATPWACESHVRFAARCARDVPHRGALPGGTLTQRALPTAANNNSNSDSSDNDVNSNKFGPL